MSTKDDESNSSSQEEDEPLYCTFAATGCHAALQDIYVCHNCSQTKQDDGQTKRDDGHEDESTALCICQSCAETCHAGHEGLQYIGLGPSYCDCGATNFDKPLACCQCNLIQESKKMASNLGIPSDGMRPHIPVTSTDGSAFIQDVFCIDRISDDVHICNKMVEQAIELVKHTRDTHWLDETLMENEESSPLCELERLAWLVYCQHAKYYNLPIEHEGLNKSGAEWWVQVKPVSMPNDLDSPSTNEDTNRFENTTTTTSLKNGVEAVDLHYDKDEDLAETFGLGFFPSLSTVTYLTPSENASPTVVFQRTYDQRDDEVIDEMLLSHPRRGKHLVFDGRLLHGAPAHHALRPLASGKQENDNQEQQQVRVTFLVNIWLTGRPSGVKPLSKDIRQLVKQSSKDSASAELVADHVVFDKLCVESIDMIDEEQLDPAIRGRIELPFVSKGATWVDDQEEGGGILLVTFPPPEHQSDTIRVKFGNGLQAYLDYEDTSEESEEDNEQDRKDNFSLEYV